jgi:hypothetical protein
VEMQWDSSTFKPVLLLVSVVEGTTWKCRGIAVHLNWTVACFSCEADYVEMQRGVGGLTGSSWLRIGTGGGHLGLR